MRIDRSGWFVLVLAACVVVACSKKSSETSVVVLKAYPMTGSLDVLSQDVAQLDDAISSDGNGAVRVHVDGPTTFACTKPATSTSKTPPHLSGEAAHRGRRRQGLPGNVVLVPGQGRVLLARATVADHGYDGVDVAGDAVLT